MAIVNTSFVKIELCFLLENSLEANYYGAFRHKKLIKPIYEYLNRRSGEIKVPLFVCILTFSNCIPHKTNESMVFMDWTSDYEVMKDAFSKTEKLVFVNSGLCSQRALCEGVCSAYEIFSDYTKEVNIERYLVVISSGCCHLFECSQCHAYNNVHGHLKRLTMMGVMVSLLSLSNLKIIRDLWDTIESVITPQFFIEFPNFPKATNYSDTGHLYFLRGLDITLEAPFSGSHLGVNSVGVGSTANGGGIQLVQMIPKEFKAPQKAETFKSSSLPSKKFSPSILIPSVAVSPSSFGAGVSVANSMGGNDAVGDMIQSPTSSRILINAMKYDKSTEGMVDLVQPLLQQKKNFSHSMEASSKGRPVTRPNVKKNLLSAVQRNIEFSPSVVEQMPSIKVSKPRKAKRSSSQLVVMNNNNTPMVLNSTSFSTPLLSDVAAVGSMANQKLMLNKKSKAGLDSMGTPPFTSPMTVNQAYEDELKVPAEPKLVLFNNTPNIKIISGTCQNSGNFSLADRGDKSLSEVYLPQSGYSKSINYDGSQQRHLVTVSPVKQQQQSYATDSWIFDRVDVSNGNQQQMGFMSRPQVMPRNEVNWDGAFTAEASPKPQSATTGLKLVIKKRSGGSNLLNK